RCAFWSMDGRLFRSSTGEDHLRIMRAGDARPECEEKTFSEKSTALDRGDRLDCRLQRHPGRARCLGLLLKTKWGAQFTATRPSRPDPQVANPIGSESPIPHPTHRTNFERPTKLPAFTVRSTQETITCRN